MTETLRSIGNQATQNYEEYRQVYIAYCGEHSTTQRKIAKHAMAIQNIDCRLAAMTNDDLVTLFKDHETGQTFTNRDLLEQELKTAQGKLEFREWEAQHYVDDVVSKGQTFYEAHQSEFNRLALIDAELDGVPINFCN